MGILHTKSKLISLVLVLCFCLSFLSATAYAEDVNDTYPSFELLGFLSIDEGINEVTAAPITRAEFTAMAVRCINPDELNFYDGSFSDVGEMDLFSKEIYIAKSLRMTSGTAPGVFSPDSPIDMAAAQKMLVTALGYESYAVALGGYPTGYSVLASRIGILKGISASGVLTVGDAKLMILNALKADKAVISGIVDGDIQLTVSKGVNLLTDNFKLTQVSGIVEKASYLSKSTAFNYDNSIKIGSLELKASFDTSEYFGKNVNAWYDDSKNLKAIEEDDGNTEIIISAEDISSYSNYKLNTYDDSGKEKSYTVESNFTFIENGRPIIYNEDSFKFNNGSLKLIDNDNNGKFEIVIAEKLEYFVVRTKSDSTETVYDSKSAIKNICFDVDNDICYIVTDSDGNILSYDNIALGNVLEVAKSADGKVCIAKVVKNDVVSGNVDELQSVGFTYNDSTYSAADMLIVGTKAYETTDYFKINHKTIDIGKSYDFILSSDGRIVSFAGNLSSDLKYGYFLGYGKGQGLDAEIQIKVLTTGDTKEIFTLADKIILDGQTVTKTDSKIKAALMNGEYPKYQVIRYDLNDSGKIDVIDTDSNLINSSWEIPEITDTNNVLTKYLDKVTMQYRNGHSFGAPYFSFKNAYLFSLPVELADNPNKIYDDDLFFVTTTEGWSGYAHSSVKFDVYDMNELYVPKLITGYMNESASTGSTVATNTSSQLVYRVTDSADDDGSITKAIYTVSDGYYNRYYINTESLAALDAAGKIPKPGYVVRMKLDVNNTVVGVEIDVTCDSDGNITLNTVGDPAVTNGYQAGIPVVAGGNNIALKSTQFPEGFEDGAALTNGIAPIEMTGSAKCVFYNTETQEAKVGTINEIKTTKNAGSGNEDYIAVRLSYYLGQQIFVYTK